MRAVICGDVHIGAVFGLGGPNKTGGNTRVDDYSRTLNWAVDYAIDSKADLFIQTGDLFEVRNPTLEHMSIADAAFKRLSNANIASFIIMGNHDYKKTGTGYTSSILSLSCAELANVKVLVDPKMIHFTSSSGDSANLYLIPYRDRRMFQGKNNKEQSAILDGLIRSAISYIQNKDPVIAVGHNFFYEGSYQDFGGSEVMVDPLAFQGCDLVAMGHLHNFRKLKSDQVNCVYTGSMEKTNFGDINIEKYLIDYDFSKKEYTTVVLPTRALLDHSIDLSGYDFSNIVSGLNASIDSLQLNEKIVRLKIMVEEKFVPAIEKNVIQSRLYSLGAFFVSKIIIEPIVKRVIKNETVLNHADDISIFKAFLESQDFDKTFRDEILKEAKEIMS